jgi:hypothetical protein
MSAGLTYAQTPSGRRRAAAAAAAVIVATMLVSSCGDSAPAKREASRPRLPGVCDYDALNAMSHTLSVGASSIATAASTGGNAMPQCAFRARLRGKRVDVLVNVDNGPQPYFVLERTIVEAAQIFPVRASPAPEQVAGLGLDASWFPAETHLEATDGKRLLTTTVDWPGVSATREIQLARAMTAPYLHTLHGKAAQAAAKGYPSGG